MIDERELFCGIDPGRTSGGIAILDRKGGVVIVQAMPDTERDTAELIEEFCGQIRMVALEKVGVMPGQGISSSGKFMRHYGFLEGLLIAFRLPYELIRPQQWQSGMGCLTKGDKNVTKAMAQRLFPTLKITHATADALLIAEHCRRVHSARFRESAVELANEVF
jgi:crossover junction endodeoxyribonuclease RuvC